MDAYSDWSHDFCLYCDTQATDGPYCSEVCRVADFRQALPFQQHQRQVHERRQEQEQTHQELLPSVSAYSQTRADPSSRHSSLSSTTSLIASSAPVNAHTPLDSLTLSEVSPPLARTSPPSPIPQPGAYFPDVAAPSLARLSSLNTGIASDRHILSDSYSPINNELSSNSSAASSPADDSAARYLDVTSHLSQAARQELKRYDDALDHSRRRRQRSGP